VTKLGTGIDKLDVDRFQVLARRMLHHTLAENQRTLLDTQIAPLSMIQSSLTSP
jgi:hypothetical protein